MKCPSCSETCPPGARFCAQCGASLPTPCPRCGAQTVPGAKFCVECGCRLAEATPKAPAARPPSSAPLVAPLGGATPERRTVSVLFCDLVGSTSLSTEIDLEDYREVLGAYHQAAAAAVEQANGFVAKYMGDGVLAYFGYPSAREDDAERAVRAGVGIARAVEALAPQGLQLKARVGVATGPVIVGDLLGSGSAQERGISGETPNLAARLQGLAEPGQVVICRSTHRLTGRLFDYGDLGEVALKGFAKAQQAFQVLSVNDSVGRFEALRSSRTPLVGREEELGVLARRWERALAGEPQVVLISAEPGVGKSRLISAFRDRIAGGAHEERAAYCAPHGGESAFFPIVRSLEARCAFAAIDSAAQKTAKLQAFLQETGADADPTAGALIGSLLSVSVDHLYPPLDLGPQRIKEETLRVLAELALDGPVGTPTLTVFEDIHWADPSTLELLRGAVVEGGGGAPRLLLVTFRPEFQPPLDWLGRPDVTNLTLTRLRASEAEAMVMRIAEGRGLPNVVLREILDRAEGVPLFVEEITRSVLEAEPSADGGAAPRILVPATLQASLVGRLDRLGPVKELAQVGAAIGREFATALLQAVVGWPGKRLEQGLQKLVDADLIFASRIGEDRGYIFKHALVQDVAYGAMLRNQRQGLHGLIADALTQSFPTQVDARPELMARHLAEAGRPREALDAWRRAAVKTMRGGSWREGLLQLDQAMRALESLPDGADRDGLELDLQMIIGGVSQGAAGHSAPSAQKAYERAYALARSLGRRRDAALSGGRLWIGPYGQGDMDGVLGRLQEVAAALADDDDERDQALVLGQMTTGYCFRGDFAAATEMAERAMAVLDPAGPLAPPEYEYMSPLTSPESVLLVGTLAMGRSDASAGYARRIEAALPAAGAMSRVIALTMLIYARYLAQDWAGVRASADQMVRAVGEIEGAGHYLDLCRLVEVRMAARSGDGDATAAIDATLERPSVAFAMQHLPRYLMIAGDAHADLGNVERARSCFEEALKGGPFGSQRWLNSELQRRLGDLALESDAAAAERWFTAAIETARSQGALLFELRAALRLHAVKSGQDSGWSPEPLLAPICARFTEPCAELASAKALLGRVSSGSLARA